MFKSFAWQSGQSRAWHRMLTCLAQQLECNAHPAAVTHKMAAVCEPGVLQVLQRTAMWCADPVQVTLNPAVSRAQPAAGSQPSPTAASPAASHEARPQWGWGQLAHAEGDELASPSEALASLYLIRQLP